ncbi:MAG: DUF1508 domain-containing protein [Jannaschia sp.]
MSGDVVNALLQRRSNLQFRIGLDRRLEWRWSLVAGNNRVIADSGEGYQNKADCYHAIELIRSGATRATITEN